MAKVVIVGGGFAGLRAARDLRDARKVDGKSRIEVTLLDERNHHLFQPLLYQVATAGLSPAEIAAPIRAILSDASNVRVLNERVETVDLEAGQVSTPSGSHPYDFLILATGARHSYFGHPEWENSAPGLKTLSQATEIRRRVLTAFENAETETNVDRRNALLTFIVVGGGPTGVELAGAIGEMSRFTLAKDFRQIDPKLARIVLLEGGGRILPMFSEKLSARAVRDLESLGVQVLTHRVVTAIDTTGVSIGTERIPAETVLWAAGVQASALNEQLGTELDRQGRALVQPDLSLPQYPNVFVAGDQAHVLGADETPLPGIAPVAMQQGAYLAKQIRSRIVCADSDTPCHNPPFRYTDKGQMATIGRKRAVLQSGRLELTGFVAWLAWLMVHVYYLVGFKNRLFVVLQWAWAYLSYRRGARLIVDRDWQIGPEPAEENEKNPPTAAP